VAREIPVVRSAGRRAGGRRRRHLVSARLQHPPAAPAGHRPESRGTLRRKLPADESTLLSFKGIGAYTAGAIRSFAFRERAAILDTNVARVLFRVIGRGTLKAHATKKHLWAISASLVPRTRAFDFNQALMDSGRARTARKPKCLMCHGRALRGLPAQPRTRTMMVVAAVIEQEGKFLVAGAFGDASGRLLGISRRQSEPG
jgi:hypothetical protein